MNKRNLFVIQMLMLFTIFISGPSFAVAQQDKQPITNIAPDDCTLLFATLGEFKLDPNGNASERWLAQPEIQKSVASFQRAISDMITSSGPMSEETQELLEKLPGLLTQPFAFYLSNFKAAVPPMPKETPSFDFGAAIELQEHEAWLKQAMAKFTKDLEENAGEDEKIEKVKLQGHDFHRLTFSEQIPMAQFGIVDGRLLFAFGEGAMDRMFNNLKSDKAPWLKKLVAETKPERLAAVFHLDATDAWRVAGLMGAPIPQFLHLEEIQAVSAVVDLQQGETVVSSLLRCPKQLIGLLSILDVDPISSDDVKEIPSKVISANGGRISFDNLWKLIKGAESEFRLDTVSNFIASMEEDTGLNFEQDILGNLEGSMFGFSKVDLINPTGGTVLALRIKDPVAFMPTFKTINQAVDDEIKFQNNGSVYDVVESNGSEIHILQVGPANFSWCLVDNQLLLGIDPSAIRSQLRKRKTSRSKWISEPRFANLFAASKSEGSGNADGDPIGVSTIDYANAIKLALPALNAAMGNNQPIPEFDFAISDLPPVEALTNGVLPSTTALYRTPAGFKLVEKSVLPSNISVAVTGIGIGMLLPAVQATRHAARRAVSANNLRQLALSNLNFAAANGSFPTSHTIDKQGNQLLSWRVHILPFLEQDELYNQFHLDEPWDSPHNKQLISKMPEIFENPALPYEPGMTSYLGVAGKDSAFAPPTEASDDGKMLPGVALKQFTDGTANTLLIVDANLDHTVIWTKPDDFDPSKHRDARVALAGTWARDLIMAVQCDGSITYLGQELTPEQIRSTMIRNDGK